MLLFQMENKELQTNATGVSIHLFSFCLFEEENDKKSKFQRCVCATWVIIYDDCSHRLLLLLLLVFDMVINQKNSNSRRDGMRLKRNILVRSTFLLQLFATLRRERKQQRRNKCCCCISTLAGAFEFLSLSSFTPERITWRAFDVQEYFAPLGPALALCERTKYQRKKGINNKPKN